jgi:hypothetical protein
MRHAFCCGTRVHLNQKGSHSFVGVLAAQQHHSLFRIDYAQESTECQWIGVNNLSKSLQLTQRRVLGTIVSAMSR